MQPRVTAVLVARNGAQYLPHTLNALEAQIRRPDSEIFVDAGSADGSAALLAGAARHSVVTTSGRPSFGAAIAHALDVAGGDPTDNEWLWLLGHDNSPSPRALSALLAAVEVAPSVAVAGPKLMRWDDPDIIASYGQSITNFGRTINLVTDELDQAQFDSNSDLLAVEATGMLVRRGVFEALGGFDPALPSADAALDFCVRARLAGHRVVGVPTARVASAGPPEVFGRRSVSAGAVNRIHRSAQLHRRFVYAPVAALPLHWLLVLPLAVLRSLVHLIAKRPGLIGGELAAGIVGAFDVAVPLARRVLRRNRQLGWRSIAALRIPWPQVRERRAHDRFVPKPEQAARLRPDFFTGGGAWVLLIAALAGVIIAGRGLYSAALTGGGLAPLSATVGELWQHVGYGWHDIGPGFLGAADPFAYLLAVLGTLTFFSPSASVIGVYVLAMPLSALGAWWCAARFSTRAWAPAVAALSWAAAPPLLASMAGGHLGAVIAHVLLPVLVLTVVVAARSWTTAALAALVFAAVAASAPVLVPALLVIWLAWLVARPTSIHRLIGIPIPAAVLFAPLIWQQVQRGNPLALLADPGVPVLNPSAAGWQLALGSADATLNGWSDFLGTVGASSVFAPATVALLLAPLAILAVLSFFLPGIGRSLPAAGIALIGLATAVVAVHVAVTMVGSTASPIWAGSGLSLYWLGLVGAAIGGLEALGRRAGLASVLVAVTAVVLAAPLFVSMAVGTSAVSANSGRLLPAFVEAEAVNDPRLGTLELSAQPDGAIAATVHRGRGTTLDEQSTLAATNTQTSPSAERLATLAGNLASNSGLDFAAELDALHIAFVLVPHDSSGPVADARQRLSDALDGNRILTPVGDTANGYLWHYVGAGTGSASAGPAPTQTTKGIAILGAQGLVFGLTLLLAIPTSRRKRLRAARVGGPSQPMDPGVRDD